jgi:hypothetical protein
MSEFIILVVGLCSAKSADLYARNVILFLSATVRMYKGGSFG